MDLVEPTTVVACLETATVSRMAGLNRSTLDYWVRTGLVGPSVRAAPGRRRSRLWSVQDAVVVRTVAELRSSGCPLQRVRKACQEIAQRGGELRSNTVLVWDGTDVLRIGRWGTVESLVRRPRQQVLRVVALPVGAWQREAEAAVMYIRNDLVASGVPHLTAEQAREVVGR